MRGRFRIAWLVFLVGLAATGVLLAQKKTLPPQQVRLAVTFYGSVTLPDGVPTVPAMLRSDTGGPYVDGIDAVKAVIDCEYGEFRFEVAKTSPRRVLFEFVEATKEACVNDPYGACFDRKGRPIPPPGLGEVNSLFMETANRAWGNAFGDGTHDFLRMPPGFRALTNIRIGFTTPLLNMFFLRHLRACVDPPQLGYVFVEAGRDIGGDGFADEWNLYPVPPEYYPAGERAVLTLIRSGGNICNFGRYSVPFQIHLEKI